MQLIFVHTYMYVVWKINTYLLTYLQNDCNTIGGGGGVQVHDLSIVWNLKEWEIQPQVVFWW